ncbi:MAG TPA: PAS domain S-box protein, partial [Acidiferrobacterales bacterium]|nr:PAS domain S-box protein [Acidiferrobacterales bacterium]
PAGRGLLGVVIAEDHALRLDDMSRDPRSAGFPPYHPPMKSLLAVPISRDGRVYGRMYFSDRHDGVPFSAEDEHLAAQAADVLGLTLSHHRLQSERRQAADTLHDIAQMLSANAGETLFHKLVLSLAKALGVDYAFVGKVSPHNAGIIQTIAFCDHGNIVDNIEYRLAPATACGSVGCRTVCYFPEGVREMYPEDEILRDFHAEAFIGHPLIGASGQVLGLLAVMHAKPLANPGQIQSILQISAARAVAELERQHTENALRESEERFRATFSQAAVGIAHIAPDGHWLQINQKLCEIVGYTESELRQRTFQDITHPDDLDADLEHVRQVLAGEIQAYSMEKRAFRKDGSIVWIDLTVSLVRDEQGVPKYFISVVEDISERKRDEEALRDANQQLQMLIQSSPLAIYTRDINGLLTSWNPAAEKMYGWKAAEVLGKPLPSVPDEVRTESDGLRMRLLAGEAFIKHEVRRRRRDGSPIDIDAFIAPLRDASGKISGIIAVVADITERKQAEAELRKLSSAIEQTADSVIITDPEGMIEYVNLAFEQTTGYSRTEALGRKPNLVNSGQHDQGFYQRLWATIQRGEPFREVFINRHKNGSIYHEEKTITPLMDKSGRITHYVSTGKDISARIHAEQENRQMQHFLNSVIENLPNMLFVKDAKDLRFVRFNKAAEETFGYSRAEMLGKNDYDFFPKAEADFFTAMDREVLNTGELMNIPLESVHTRHQGERWLHTRKIPILDESGQPQYLLGIAEDITERRMTEDRAARLGRILERSSNEIYVFDAATLKFTQVNQGALKNLGYTLDELLSLTAVDLKPAFTPEQFRELIEPLRRGDEETLSFETEHKRKDGSLYPVEVHLQFSSSETPPVFVAVISDITERKQAQERLNYLAFYDTLTGLPNRLLLLDRIRQATFECERLERLVAIMFLDLDRFKLVNDTLGHEAGDLLLKSVAGRLSGCVRPGDTVARLGGDEFTVILANVAHVDDVGRVAQKVLDVFAAPFLLAGQEVFVSPSIGITLYPFDDTDLETLLKNADVAMYHAKDSGRNTFQFFTPELNARTARRLGLETALRRALERDEFVLHYQPQVDLTSGRITGMEALIRWQRADTGMVSPLEFIPLAEETGLIVPIGEWVLRTACAQNRAWQEAGLPALRMSVNIAARQFQQQNLTEVVARVLKETGLDPRWLMLEITESTVMRDAGAAIETLRQIGAQGVGLSVDDFGTGYSSLSYLKRFP